MYLLAKFTLGPKTFKFYNLNNYNLFSYISFLLLTILVFTKVKKCKFLFIWRLIMLGFPPKTIFFLL